jgi:hypothetical protein
VITSDSVPVHPFPFEHPATYYGAYKPEDRLERWGFLFANGYGASVVRWVGYTPGAEDGFWELAVLRDGELCYETPVTPGGFGEVLTYLTNKDVAHLLDRICRLVPAATTG